MHSAIDLPRVIRAARNLASTLRRNVIIDSVDPFGDDLIAARETAGRETFQAILDLDLQLDPNEHVKREYPTQLFEAFNEFTSILSPVSLLWDVLHLRIYRAIESKQPGQHLALDSNTVRLIESSADALEVAIGKPTPPKDESRPSRIASRKRKKTKPNPKAVLIDDFTITVGDVTILLSDRQSRVVTYLVEFGWAAGNTIKESTDVDSVATEITRICDKQKGALKPFFVRPTRGVGGGVYKTTVRDGRPPDKAADVTVADAGGVKNNASL